MTILDWALIGAVFFSFVGLLMTVVNLRCYKPPFRIGARAGASPAGDGAAAGETELVSVCIPARNEEANIEPCVRSLLAQTHARLEVLAYNDQSTDATGTILERLVKEDARVRVVPTVPLPTGWNGKQWGCDNMGRAAKGRWLLFTDADVRFEPSCVELTLGSARALDTAMLSTFPRQITGTLAEVLAVPMIHFILFSYLPMPRMRGTMDPAASAACGQFILCRADAYGASGGHGAFKASMHDGVMMPRAVRRAGFKTDLFDGTRLCEVRMYRGLMQVWRGFTKNAFEGLGSIGLLVFVTLVHLLAHVLPWCVLGWLAIAALRGIEGLPVLASALAVLCVLMHLVQRALLAARFAQSLLGVALHPLGVLMMTTIQWHSWWLHITGRRAWKGRVQAAPAA